mmetsp:Transcript_45884/g.127434  ORF Transcript_45884/g.127434 Transcript_45884/m.127434 type:complete len:243 (+) Transcript_45884:379-1107(+)
MSCSARGRRSIGFAPRSRLSSAIASAPMMTRPSSRVTGLPRSTAASWRACSASAGRMSSPSRSTWGRARRRKFVPTPRSCSCGSRKRRKGACSPPRVAAATCCRASLKTWARARWALCRRRPTWPKCRRWAAIRSAIPTECRRASIYRQCPGHRTSSRSLHRNDEGTHARRRRRRRACRRRCARRSELGRGRRARRGGSSSCWQCPRGGGGGDRWEGAACMPRGFFPRSALARSGASSTCVS